MYYCFLSEDTDGLADDPLILQKEYAKRIGALLIGSLAQQKILHAPASALFDPKQRVLLRCTYDNLLAGLRLLKMSGAELVETEADAARIEDWYKLGLTKRLLWEATQSDFLAVPSKRLGMTDKIFVKSKSKGFSAVIRTSRIVQHDPAVIAFLETQRRMYGDIMVCSKYIPIKTDSLGSRETRHIIFNNQLANSSRCLHPIKHTVPRSHKIKAQEIADQIKAFGFFPSNYVLDLGEFIDNDGNSYVDIVEINPLSCSMCFVNNSIFDIAVPEISEAQKFLQMGYEFCFDALRNPQRYAIARISNKKYSYGSDKRYIFL